jgi:hypothetical protein
MMLSLIIIKKKHRSPNLKKTILQFNIVNKDNYNDILMLKAFYRSTKNPEDALIGIKALTSTKKTWLIDR